MKKQTIIVVGGGSAGWMAAGYLSVKGFDVTLIESPDVPIVGVGESTVPAINWLANEMGMQEHEWMPLSSATFKLGIKHNDWTRPGDSWYNFFLYDRTKDKSQHRYLDTDDLPPREALEYGYHVDAHEFGETISKTAAQKHNCRHVVAHISEVIGDPINGVQKLVTQDGQEYTADFYVDCTGFRKLLASKVEMRYHQYTEHLNDRAIACPQPLLPKSNRYTTTTAKSVGWIWEVPLTNRRGAGYVYSSKHITDEDAITEYCEHYLDTDPAKIRKLKFTPEVCKDSIKTNVGVAGLSGGFIEPLEATAIFLTFFTIRQIYKFLNGERKAAVLNRNVEKVFNHVSSYVLMHYTMSGRTDNAYWQHYADLEKQLNTRKECEEKAALPDTLVWQESSLFFPYSYWALLNGYNNK